MNKRKQVYPAVYTLRISLLIILFCFQPYLNGFTHNSHTINHSVSFPLLQEQYFIQNAGQWSDDVQFAVLGEEVTIFFLQNSIIINYHPIEYTTNQITFSFLDSYLATIQGLKKLPFSCSYIHKNGSYEANIFQEITYLDAWNGTDLRFFFLNQRLAIEILSKQKDDNSSTISINILQNTKNPFLKNLFFVPLKKSPLFYNSNLTKSVTPSFFQTSFNLNSTSIPHKKLSYYLLDEIFAGSEEDEAHAFCVVDNKKVYIAGETRSPDLSGDYEARLEWDIFVLLYDLNNRQIQKIIFLTGSGNDYKPTIMAKQNRIIISGNTYSSDLFPIKSESYQAEHAGMSDVFIAVFSEDLQTLEYSSFLGGTGNDFIEDIVMYDGKLVLSGTTTSEDFPKPSRLNSNNKPFQPVIAGQRDIFIAVLSENMAHLDYSTYYGGSNIDDVVNITLHEEELYLVGSTKSQDFHTENAYDIEFNDDNYADGFIVKWNLAKNSLVFSTFIGGSNKDGCVDIAILDKKILVIGTTDGSNLPTSVGALQRINAGMTDIFLAIMPDNGRELLYLTYLGGEGSDICHDLELDSSNNIIIAGETTSTSFGKRTIEHQGDKEKSDCFIFQISSDLSNITDIRTTGGSHSDTFVQMYSFKNSILLLGNTNSDDIILEESFPNQVNRHGYTNLNFFLMLITLKDKIEAPVIDFYTKDTESYQNKITFKGKITDYSSLISRAMISVNNSEKETLVLNQDSEFEQEVKLNDEVNIITVEAWNMFEIKSSKAYSIKRLFIPSPPKECNFYQPGDYIELSWETPGHTSYPVVSYSIKKYKQQSNQEKDLILTQSVDQNSFQDNTIAIHDTYIYVLQSIDSVGKRSVESEEFSIKVADFTPPSIQISSELVTSTEEEKIVVKGLVRDDESGLNNIKAIISNDKFPPENPWEIKKEWEKKKQDSFEFSLPLEMGENFIQIIAENGDGFKAGYPEEKWEITRDPVDVESPIIEEDLYPRNYEHFNPIITISGHIKDRQNNIDRCTVNKAPVELQSDGSFSIPVTLKTGENVILIEAWDRNQNYNKKEIKIFFSRIRLVKLTINSKTAFVDGAKKLLDVPPTIINNRTLVPIRFISESLDSTVDYLDFSKSPKYATHEILIGNESKWYQLYVNQTAGFIQNNLEGLIGGNIEPVEEYTLPADCPPRFFPENSSIPYIPLSWMADSLGIQWSTPNIKYLPSPTNEVQLTWDQKVYHFWFDGDKKYQVLIEYFPELNKKPDPITLKYPPIFDQNSNILMFLSLEDTARLFGFQYRYRVKTPPEIRITRLNRLIRIWIQETESLVTSLNYQNIAQVRMIKLDIPPQIKQSRTLVPIRFISESLGAKVDYEAALKEITIKLPIAE